MARLTLAEIAVLDEQEMETCTDNVTPPRPLPAANSIFKHLVPDIFFQIFEYPVITPEDRVAFALTCKDALHHVFGWGARGSPRRQIERVERQSLQNRCPLTDIQFDPRFYWVLDDPLIRVSAQRFFEANVFITVQQILERCKSHLDKHFKSFCPLLYSNAQRHLPSMSWFSSPSLSDGIWYIEPTYSPELDGNTNVLELITLGMTALFHPWLFFHGHNTSRACISCTARIDSKELELPCEERHMIRGGDILARFGCSKFPHCFDEERSSKTYTGRVMGGLCPRFGLECARLYWQCQAEMTE